MTNCHDTDIVRADPHRYILVAQSCNIDVTGCSLGSDAPLGTSVRLCPQLRVVVS